MSTDPRLPRLLALLEAAKNLADPQSDFGRRARAELGESTGLSPAGVDWALSQCLEHRTSRSQITQLLRRTAPVPRAHVLLSANVFTAAFRAITLALLQTDTVFVRPSRREPLFTQLLAEASGQAFQIVDSLAPAPSDHLWAYGTDETLAQVRQKLPGGVYFHTHGSGLGVAVLSLLAQSKTSDLERCAELLVRDTLAFDQRGCASPRFVFLQTTDESLQKFLPLLEQRFRQAEQRIPRGPLSATEQADALRYERTRAYVGPTWSTGRGIFVLDDETKPLYLPPVGRYLALVRTHDPLTHIQALAPLLTCVGVWGSPTLPGQILELLQPRRVVELGQMQMPPLDGPLDLRAPLTGELI